MSWTLKHPRRLAKMGGQKRRRLAKHRSNSKVRCLEKLSMSEPKLPWSPCPGQETTRRRRGWKRRLLERRPCLLHRLWYRLRMGVWQRMRKPVVLWKERASQWTNFQGTELQVLGCVTVGPFGLWQVAFYWTQRHTVANHRRASVSCSSVAPTEMLRALDRISFSVCVSGGFLCGVHGICYACLVSLQPAIVRHLRKSCYGSRKVVWRITPRRWIREKIREFVCTELVFRGGRVRKGFNGGLEGEHRIGCNGWAKALPCPGGFLADCVFPYGIC